MDLQQLQNFLIVAQEENITHAAEYLHISQPALSRQIQALEEELGKPLLVRQSKKVSLTKEGVLLRKRASEITQLVTKTTNELTASSHELSGDILLGVSETDAVRYVGECANRLIDQHPQVTLKLKNGDNAAVLAMVNSGQVDLGLYFGAIDRNIFNHIQLPAVNQFGALMPKTHPLAKKEVVTPADLAQQALILYQPSIDDNSLAAWFHRETTALQIAGTFGMYLSAKKLVESGLGIALVFNNLVAYDDQSDLVMRPIIPEISVPVNLIWKKYQIFSDAAEALLTLIRQQATGVTGDSE